MFNFLFIDVLCLSHIGLLYVRPHFVVTSVSNIKSIEDLHSQNSLRVTQNNATARSQNIINDAYFKGTIEELPNFVEHLNQFWVNFLNCGDKNKKAMNFSGMYEGNRKPTTPVFPISRRLVIAYAEGYGIRKHAKFQTNVSPAALSHGDINNELQVELLIGKKCDLFRKVDSRQVGNSLFSCLFN